MRWSSEEQWFQYRGGDVGVDGGTHSSAGQTWHSVCDRSSPLWGIFYPRPHLLGRTWAWEHIDRMVSLCRTPFSLTIHTASLSKIRMLIDWWLIEHFSWESCKVWTSMRWNRFELLVWNLVFTFYIYTILEPCLICILIATRLWWLKYLAPTALVLLYCVDKW